MRNATFIAVVITSLLPVGGVAQAPAEFPAGAEGLEARLMARVGPQTRAWIQQEGARLAATDAASEATATRAVASNRALGDLGDGDVTTLAFLVMMEAAKSAREDLKAIMDHVKQINDAKAALRQPARRDGAATANRSATSPAAAAQPQALPNASRVAVQPRPMTTAEFNGRLDREKNDLDSLNEMGEMESLRLQMAMDRLARLMSTLSNILKKISDTAATITQNLK